VTYPGFTPVGNATLVVANVLTCNKHSQICCWLSQAAAVAAWLSTAWWHSVLHAVHNNVRLIIHFDSNGCCTVCLSLATMLCKLQLSYHSFQSRACVLPCAQQPMQQCSTTVQSDSNVHSGTFKPQRDTTIRHKVHLWFTCSAGQGNLPTAAKWF
jgi:hypothetical protein